MIPPTINEFPPAKQQRLDALLDRNAEGALDDGEEVELESLVADAEALMVANARLLADFARGQSPAPPTGAVPVTVWVTPQPADT
jgi:hypothetical protein